MKQTQYQIIQELHSQSDWVCGNAYRARFIFSAHKRRSEMIKMKLCAGFDWRPCEHGFENVRDYKLIPVDGAKTKDVINVDNFFEKVWYNRNRE